MNFNIDFKQKYFLITGVANKKSLAYFVAKQLQEFEAKIILSVQNEKIKETVQGLFDADTPILICDVKDENQIIKLPEQVSKITDKLHGLLHSLAYANFAEKRAFHETPRRDVIEALTISAYSLVEMSNALKSLFTKSASVVTISISNTLATSYGYLGPIKALLEHYVAYLAKSFSEDSSVRFNAIKSGPLKTSASSGIPGYLENYLYSELLTLRKKGLETKEVAQLALFLLSSFSSGINGSSQLIDLGMNANYFDQDVVKTVVKNTF